MIIQVELEDMDYWESHAFLDDVSLITGVEIERVDQV